MAGSRQKRQLWTQEADNKLKEFRCKYPYLSWSDTAKLAKLGKNGKSCRERWKNHHDPSLKKGNFSQEEDDTIIDLQRNYGNKWAWIASYLRRSESDIKNRWYNYLIEKVRRSTNENIPDPQSSIGDQPYAIQLFHPNRNIDPKASSSSSSSSSSIPTPVSSSQEIVNQSNSELVNPEFPGACLQSDDETIHHSFVRNYFEFEPWVSGLKEFIPTKKDIGNWSD